jgi:hypothetical protein
MMVRNCWRKFVYGHVFPRKFNGKKWYILLCMTHSFLYIVFQICYQCVRFLLTYVVCSVLHGKEVHRIMFIFVCYSLRIGRQLLIKAWWDETEGSWVLSLKCCSTHTLEHHSVVNLMGTMVLSICQVQWTLVQWQFYQFENPESEYSVTWLRFKPGIT